MSFLPTPTEAPVQRACYAAQHGLTEDGCPTNTYFKGRWADVYFKGGRTTAWDALKRYQDRHPSGTVPSFKGSPRPVLRYLYA